MSENYVLQGIPSQHVAHFWHFAEPYIKRALDHANGEFTPDDFKQSCIDRNLQLWLIAKGTRVYGAVTTELVVYPQRKHCRIITLAGSNFSEWVEMANETIDKWAVEQGCNGMEAFVRRGIVPKMTPFGYKNKHVVMVKELNKE